MARTVKPAVKKAVAAKPGKVASKKSSQPATETGIKYTDKSGDQPQLVPVFDAIKKLLLPYGKGNIKIRGGTGGQITLVSEKPVEIEGKKRNELWFAAALVQRGYVGFYFMPVRTEPEKKEVFKPELLKCLKGKGCFHINKFDSGLFKQIADALAKGYNIYKDRGLI